MTYTHYSIKLQALTICKLIPVLFFSLNPVPNAAEKDPNAGVNFVYTFIAGVYYVWLR